MAMDSTTQDVNIQMHPLASAQTRRPLLHLVRDTKEARAEYIKVALILHTLAATGNWEDFRRKLDEDRDLVKTAITKGGETPLHVAVEENHVHFVEELVKLMADEYLELQDCNGNTAFFLAAGVGNRRLAEIMMNRNASLPTIRDAKERTPLHFAVIQGKDEMARFLYHNTATVQGIFQEQEWAPFFLTCIKTDIYDLALDMLELKPLLALDRDDNHDTGLHLLARKQLKKPFKKQNHALQLVRRLWSTIVTELDQESEIHEIIRNPSPLVIDAAVAGNFEFLAQLLSIFPDLIKERDCKNRTMIHVAVEHRHARIFNLIHEIGSGKDSIVTSADVDGNNLLHLAAKLAPPDQLNLVTGAAFQLMHDLLWFEEVKKIMPPLHIDMKNSDGLSACQLFTEEHRKLLEKAEQWMKDVARSCIMVSVVIAAGDFLASFSLLDGNDNKGISNESKNPAFLAFRISNTTMLMASVTSTLISLSIIISRHAESDFYKLLPLKLIVGFVTLFISIVSMMVACSSAIVIVYDLKWVPNFVYVLAFVIVPVFVLLQLLLWFDVLRSTYYCWSLFWPNNRSLFQPNKAYALLGKSKDV